MTYIVKHLINGEARCIGFVLENHDGTWEAFNNSGELQRWVLEKAPFFTLKMDV